jgi:uncharacterized protein
MYFRQACSNRGIEGEVSLSTNGVFPERRIEFIAAQCDRIAFSIDGLPESHDANRVLPNGNGSFNVVLKNLLALESRGARIDVRATVTASATAVMPSFVRYMGEHTEVKSIHFEPVFSNLGLAKTAEDAGTPDASAFVSAFRAARRVACNYEIELYYSGSEMQARESFCGVSNARNFLVTSRGLVTSCNEVLQPWDRRAETFQYGAWDDAQQRFVFDQAKLERLFHINVLGMRKCEGCFAKLNCAGDCYARNAAPSGDPMSEDYTNRCHLARELLKDNLGMALTASAICNIIG